MNSRFWTTSALMLFAASLFVLPAQALADRGPHGKGQHMKKMIEELNLTEDQQAKVQSIMQQFREGKKGQKEQMRAERKALWNLASQDQVNEGQVREQFRKVASLRENLFVERVKMMQQVRAVLTPEQQAKWQQLKQEKMKKFRERHGRPDSRDTE